MICGGERLLFSQIHLISPTKSFCTVSKKRSALSIVFTAMGTVCSAEPAGTWVKKYMKHSTKAVDQLDGVTAAF